MRRKLPLTAQAAAADAPRLEEDLPTAEAAADAAAWRAEVKRFRGARLGRRNGLTPRPTAMCTWWVQPAGRAGGRSWGPGGSWQAQSGAVMAARCHQSFKAAALPGRFTRRLAGREHVEESCAAPRTRSSLGRVTLLRARYRARQQGARSRHRSAACQARAGGAPSARPRRPRRRRTAPHPHRRLRWARKMPQNRGAIGAAAPPRPASRRLKRSDVV